MCYLRVDRRKFRRRGAGTVGRRAGRLGPFAIATLGSGSSKAGDALSRRLMRQLTADGELSLFSLSPL